MKAKGILAAVALLIVIGGAVLLYNALKDSAPRPGLILSPSAPPASETTSSPDASPEPPDMAPDFTVQDAQGEEVKLSDLLGKPIVLNFWASWCGPCRSEMPEFEKLYQELGDSVQFVMVDAVDGSRETVETGAAFISEQGYTFPVYFDVRQDALIQYGIRAFPTSIFIDRDGVIVTGYEGALDEETLRQGIALIS